MRSKIKLAPANSSDPDLPTSKLARTFGVKEQTPRASLCRNGHWMGMVPVKLPNGRLLWSAAEAERLLSGEARQQTSVESGTPSKERG